MPARIGHRQLPAEAIMQSKSAIGPKLDLDGRNPKAAPEGRARRVGPMLCGDARDFGHKAGAPGQRL